MALLRGSLTLPLSSLINSMPLIFLHLSNRNSNNNFSEMITSVLKLYTCVLFRKILVHNEDIVKVSSLFLLVKILLLLLIPPAGGPVWISGEGCC